MDISTILRALSPTAQIILLACLFASAMGVILIFLVVALSPSAARNISLVLSSIDRLLRMKGSRRIGRQVSTKHRALPEKASFSGEGENRTAN